MKIKPELTGNQVLECLKLIKKISTGGDTPHEPTAPRSQCQFPSYAPDVTYRLKPTRSLTGGFYHIVREHGTIH